jgi:hypothetical protein
MDCLEIPELIGRDERLVALRSRQQAPKSGHLDNFFGVTIRYWIHGAESNSV